MRQIPGSLTQLIVIILSLVGFTTGCSPAPGLSDVQLDQGDTIEYAFGGGEAGAAWTQVTIWGDGYVTYLYHPPYDGIGAPEEITIEYRLPEKETQALFTSLVKAGLFDLQHQETMGADIPRTSVKAVIDQNKLDIAMDGTPPAEIHGQIEALIAEIHPEK